MSRNEKRHGFNEDAETLALLRSPPSEAALAWASERVGAVVDRWEVLRGGMSSAMYGVAFSGEAPVELVLRCYVRADLNREEPDLAVRESAALRAASAAEILTPELVAVDPMGERVGVPALLMTRLVGRVVWDPTGVDGWLQRLAEVLPAVHAVESGHEPVGVYENYALESYAPPKWATKTAIWERAAEVFHGPILDEGRCFIHRDYHPGNVLWKRGHVTGVVDWQSACIGPPSVDIGHCRANFLGYAPELADRFTGFAEEALGTRFHPWADIAALIGMLDGLRRTPPCLAGREAIEAAVEHAVAALTRP